jgi:RNA polymerase sigma-70 factor, ECF subfamily
LKNSLSHTTEKLLIEKLMKGDSKAFSHLFEQYATNLLYVARRYVYHQEEAEEIVQETFYRVWKYRGNMNPALSFKAYIITIAKRLIFNRAKKRMHELAYQEYFVQNFTDGESCIDEYIDIKELEQKIKHAIENLPSKRKEIFVLSREKGLTTIEIANKMNISTSTVENQINKAIKCLREAIAIFLFLCFSADLILKITTSKFFMTG